MTLDTHTESYRHECEVRHVASMASNEDRKRYLQGVAEHRGEAAAERLRQGAWEILRARQEA